MLDLESASSVEVWEEPGDLNAVQRRILKDACEAFHADVCTLLALNPITGGFASQPLVTGDLWHPEDWRFDPPRPQGVARQVLERGELLVPDLSAAPEFQNPFCEREGIRSFAAIALKDRSRPKPFAVLYIDYRQPQQLDGDLHDQLRRFALEASGRLQNAWLLNRYRRVTELAQEINQELEPEIAKLFHRLDRHLSEILDTSYFLMLATYSEQRQALGLYSKYKSNYTVMEQHDLTPGFRRVIESPQKLIIQNYSRDPEAQALNLFDFDPDDPENPESLIFLPLLLRGIPLGVLTLQHLKPYAYDDEDVHLLEILATHIASALSNIRLFNDLTQLSETGQWLTEHSEGKDILQDVVERIRQATRADLVILYPYHQDREQGKFELPPTTAGDFLVPDFPQPLICLPDDSPYRVIGLDEPRFFEETTSEEALFLSSLPGHPSEFQKREQIASFAALPLRVGGESVGALYLNYRRPQIFIARRRHVAQGLAVFAAIAIKNAWKLSRRGRELEILNRIDAKLARKIDLDDVLKTILEEANQIVKADTAAVLLADLPGNQLRTASYIGHKPKPAEAGIIRWVFEKQEPVVVADVKNDPQWRKIYVTAIRSTTSEMAVPLLVGKRAIGVLNFESPRKGAFSEDDLKFVKTLAGQVVLGVKKAQLYERTRNLAVEREILIRLTKQVVSQLELESVLDLILRRAVDTTRAEAGVLFLYDEQSQHLVVRSEIGADADNRGQRLPLSQGVTGRAASEKRPLYIPDVDVPEWKKVFLRYATGMRSAFAVPLRSGEKLWGVLNLESRSLNGFKPVHRHLVTAFADVAVIALQNAQSHETARQELARFKALLQAGQKLGELSQDNERLGACKIVTAEVSQSRECRAVIRIYEESSQDLVLVDATGKWTQTDATWKRMKNTAGLNGWVFQSRRPGRYDNTKDIPAGMPKPELWDALTRSLLIVPIMFAGVYYGNLSLSHRDPYYFTDADQGLGEGLARLLAITFHRLDAVQRYKDLQEYSKQAEVMGAIGEAAYDLEHRLSNDLGPIRSYVNNIRKDLQGWPASKSKVDLALKGIVKSMDLVLEMSDKLKREAGTFRLGGAGDAVNQSVEVIMHDLREEFRSLPSSIVLQIRFDPDVGFVLAHPEHPRQILSHLVRNAWDAMPDGGRIEIETKNNGPFIQIRVADAGSGIPKEDRGKIFRFLYSSKKSSGFGLWSARKKAQLNGGSLDLDEKSPAGEGAVFILKLPRADHPVEVQFEH